MKSKSIKHEGFTIKTLETLEAEMKQQGVFNAWDFYKKLEKKPNWYTLNNIIDYLLRNGKLKRSTEDSDVYEYVGDKSNAT